MQLIPTRLGYRSFQTTYLRTGKNPKHVAFLETPVAVMGRDGKNVNSTIGRAGSRSTDSSQLCSGWTLRRRPRRSPSPARVSIPIATAHRICGTRRRDGSVATPAIASPPRPARHLVTTTCIRYRHSGIRGNIL